MKGGRLMRARIFILLTDVSILRAQKCLRDILSTQYLFLDERIDEWLFLKQWPIPYALGSPNIRPLESTHESDIRWWRVNSQYEFYKIPATIWDHRGRCWQEEFTSTDFQCTQNWSVFGERYLIKHINKEEIVVLGFRAEKDSATVTWSIPESS